MHGRLFALKWAGLFSFCTFFLMRKSPSPYDHRHELITSPVGQDTMTESPPPKFLFLIGLEGTGHHLYNSMIKRSPAKAAMKRHSVTLDPLQRLLYDNFHKENSLWGSPCSQKYSDTGEILQQVVATLKDLDKQVDGVALPINGPRYGKNGFGMMSYPNYSTSTNCKALQYPNIGLLYEACDQANVRCEHIYISRDLYSVLKSTVYNRQFHSLQNAVHLYTTMLSIIHQQLLEFPDRTAACWQYEEPGDAWPIGKLLGWKSKSEFEALYSTMFKPSPIPAHSFVPPELEPYMKSMVKANNMVMDLCRDIRSGRGSTNSRISY